MTDTDIISRIASYMIGIAYSDLTDCEKQIYLVLMHNGYLRLDESKEWKPIERSKEKKV